MKDIRILSEAILNLLPNVPVHIDGTEYHNIKTLDGTPLPSKEVVMEEFEKIKKYYENSQYQRDRAPLYPSLADFADAFYWYQKGDNSKMEAYVAKCDSVKSQYPKPESK